MPTPLGRTFAGLLGLILAAAAWADPAPAPLQQGLSLVGSSWQSPGQDAKPEGFLALFQPGVRTWAIDLAWAKNHNLPTGPRTDIVADMVKLQYGRLVEPTKEWALEMCIARMQANKSFTNVGMAVDYRRYFSLKPRRAAYWQLGLGLTHLDRLVPELATHTNFVEHIGVGLKWPAGSHGAWGIEYRFQHISNGGRKHPNIGLNSSMLVFGFTTYR